MRKYERGKIKEGRKKDREKMMKKEMKEYFRKKKIN